MLLLDTDFRGRTTNLSQKTSKIRRDVPMRLSSGPIAIERVSTSEARSGLPRGKATAISRSSGHGSAISKERKPTPHRDSCRRRTKPLFSHILSAARRLTALDDKQVDAVSARIELDLRIGYAFTRFLTLNLRPLGGPLSKLTLSYGKRTSHARTSAVHPPNCSRVLPVSYSRLRRGSVFPGQEFRPRDLLGNQNDAREGRHQGQLQLVQTPAV